MFSLRTDAILRRMIASCADDSDVQHKTKALTVSGMHKEHMSESDTRSVRYRTAGKCPARALEFLRGERGCEVARGQQLSRRQPLACDGVSRNFALDFALVFVLPFLPNFFPFFSILFFHSFLFHSFRSFAILSHPFPLFPILSDSFLIFAILSTKLLLFLQFLSFVFQITSRYFTLFQRVFQRVWFVTVPLLSFLLEFRVPVKFQIQPL